MSISFHVPGVPRPQGSKRGYVNRHTGKVAMVESAKGLDLWRSDVRAAAIEAMGGRPPLEGPVQLDTWFYFARPASHPRTKATFPKFADADKLARAVADALTGICYIDDVQVTTLLSVKRWADHDWQPGAVIYIHREPLEVLLTDPRQTRGVWEVG